jgi:RND family efflux transporter MFP subunit
VLKQSNQAFLAFIIVIAACLVAGVFIALKTAPETVTIAPPILTVDVAQVEKQTLSISVNSQGTVRPHTKTTLAAEVSGKVLTINPRFESGGLVEKGQLLLSIDDRDYQVELKRAEAAVATAKSHLIQEQGQAAVARQDIEKYPRKLTSRAALGLALREPQLEEAQARLDSALADLSYAKNNLSRTQIRAPYRGMINSRQVNLGQIVAAGSALGEIFSVDRAEVRLPIPVDRLSYLELPGINKVEHEAAVNLSNELGQQWSGRLVRTEATLDERSRVLFAIAAINDPYQLDQPGQPILRVGSFVKAEISGKQIKGLVAIPRHILHTGNKIWVVDDEQKLSYRIVKILRTEGQFVYVYEGLEEGEIICLSTIPNAIAGTKVKIDTQVKTSALLPPTQSSDVAAIPSESGAS